MTEITPMRKNMTLPQPIYLAYFFVLLCISGCSTIPFSGDDVQEEDNKVQTLQQPTKEVTANEKKITNPKFEEHLSEWLELKPSVKRLIAIEGELLELIEQLSAMTNKPSNIATKNKTQPTFDKGQKLPTEQVSPVEIPKLPLPRATTISKERQSYALQLAALNEKVQIKTTWNALVKKHPSILNTLELTYEESIVNSKTYYRVKAGKFNDKATAIQLCKQLIILKTNCIPTIYKGTVFKL